MASFQKSLAQAIRDRRSTPSFDGEPIPPRDLWQILDAGLAAPSGYNIQPWRFIVVQHPEQRRRLRAASYNQAKVEEASAMIVACGDRDGWSGTWKRCCGWGERRECRRAMRRRRRHSVPEYLANFSHEEMASWLNKQVTIAITHDDVDGRGAGVRYGGDGGFEQQAETLSAGVGREKSWSAAFTRKSIAARDQRLYVRASASVFESNGFDSDTRSTRWSRMSSSQISRSCGLSMPRAANSDSPYTFSMMCAVGKRFSRNRSAVKSVRV